MAVDIFDTQTFLKALPPGSEIGGLEMGEYVFYVPVDAGCSVHVRSSIHADGDSAEAGQDSIRMSLWDKRQNKFMGKLDTYTTRVSGWGVRISAKISYLSAMRGKAGDCRMCGNPKHIFVVEKEGSNKGRVFAKCNTCDAGFVWLDIPTTPWFKANDNEITEATTAGNSLADALADLDRIYGDDLEGPHDVLQVPVVDMRSPNAEQQAAIDAPFVPVRVEAGPGAGKTYTIARRYKKFVDTGISPSKIVAVTFNVKMGSELATKIIQMVPSVEGTEAERTICTIHALCLRLLKGYYPKYRTYQVAPDWWIKKYITEQLEAKYSSELRPSYEEVRDVIWSAKGKGYNASLSSIFYNNLLGALYGEGVTEIHDGLEKLMEEQRYTSFADMLLLTELALRFDEDFKRWAQSNVDALIVDEAQDTNAQSMRILAMLAERCGNFFIVGDRDQLLYRFTGATPEANLGEGFEERFPEGLSFPLGINYRSDQEIVEMSRKLISFNYSPEGPYDSKYLKDLRPRGEAPLGVKFTLNRYPTAISEGIAIRDQVQSLVNDNGVNPGEIFIGFRTRAQAGYLEYAFAQTDIPFVNTTGISFWTMKHVQDILIYLRAAVHPDTLTEEEFKRIMNIPSKDYTVPWKNHPDYGKYCNHRFLGNAFVVDTQHSISRIKGACQKTYKYQPGGSDLLDLLSEIKNSYYSDGTGEAIRCIIDNCYRVYVNYESGNAENSVGEGNRIEDLLTAADVADTFPSLDDFIEYVDKIIASTKSQEAGDWTGKVVLSTIHRLKGLEREYVFGAGISEYDPTIERNPVTGLLPHTFSMTMPPNVGKFDIYGMGRIEDERCLFYVLITRAKKVVRLSSITNYRRTVMRPSRFIYELGLTEIYERDDY